MRSLISWHSLQLGQRARLDPGLVGRVRGRRGVLGRGAAGGRSPARLAEVAAGDALPRSRDVRRTTPAPRSTPPSRVASSRSACESWTPPCSCRRRHSSRQRRAACIRRRSTTTRCSASSRVDGRAGTEPAVPPRSRRARASRRQAASPRSTLRAARARSAPHGARSHSAKSANVNAQGSLHALHAPRRRTRRSPPASRRRRWGLFSSEKRAAQLPPADGVVAERREGARLQRRRRDQVRRQAAGCRDPRRKTR